MEGIFFNIVIALYKNRIANNVLNGEKLKVFPMRWQKAKISTISTFVQHQIRSPSNSNYTKRKKSKEFKLEKRK